MLRTRIRPEIDPDEYLRSHPVLTASDLAAASQVGQLPGTAPDEQEMTFSLDEVDALPGVAPAAPTALAPLGIGWDDVRGGLNRAASGLTSGLRSVGDLARQSLPAIDPWEGEPEPLANGGNMFANASPFQIPDHVDGSFSGGAMQVRPMGSRRGVLAAFGRDAAEPALAAPVAEVPAQGFALPGTLPDAPEQPATAASAPLQSAATPTAPQAPTMPQMPGMLPGTAMDAMPAPGANPFRTTDADRKSLEDAEKRDNRLRIASGIMRGLGFLTQFGAGIAGNNALGNAAGAAATNFAPQIDGAEQVRARIAERQANDYRAMQFDQGQQDRLYQRQSAQAQMQRQAELDALNAQYRQAQIQQTDLRTAQIQNELDAVGNDASAARLVVEHFAAGLNDDSDMANELRATIADPRWQGASAQTARDVLARYTQIGSRRGAGLMDNGGGGGGGYREIINSDGTVTRVRVPGSVGGGRGGAARGGGAPMPPRPVQSAAEIAGEPLSADEDQAANVFIDAMRARGIDPASDSGRRELRANLYAYRNAPSNGARADVINDARNRISIAAEAEAGGLPPGVTQAALNAIPESAVRNWAAVQATEQFIARLQRYNQENPRALWAVLSGADIQNGALGAGLDQIAMRMRSDLQGQINAVLSRLAGANVTENEMERNLRALNVGSVASNVNDVIRNFRNRTEEQNLIVEGHLRTVPPAVQAYWLGLRGDR